MLSLCRFRRGLCRLGEVRSPAPSRGATGYRHGFLGRDRHAVFGLATQPVAGRACAPITTTGGRSMTANFNWKDVSEAISLDRGRERPARAPAAVRRREDSTDGAQAEIPVDAEAEIAGSDRQISPTKITPAIAGASWRSTRRRRTRRSACSNISTRTSTRAARRCRRSLFEGTYQARVTEEHSFVVRN